ncbi:hypothetical protein SUDANB1_05641 [Streptomyces sp. enrichment culture]|uniref:hypothetical protein n=1 Tax=Streptomyces sp. enrichment culture TaxID=1795815 RepID=UPI003F551B3B
MSSKKDAKEIFALLRAAKARVVPSNGHWKATHPAASRPVWIETSPGDCRSKQNKIAELRRYGFPIPDSRPPKKKKKA